MTTHPPDLFVSGRSPVPTNGGPSLLSRLVHWLDAWKDRRHLHALSERPHAEGHGLHA